LILWVLSGAASVGIQRLVGKLSRSSEPGTPPDNKARLDALGQTPAFYRAMLTGMRAIDAHDEALRKPGATGDLGDLPLVVITHGQPFPGPLAVVERHWAEGQKRLAALSTQGELVVAHESNHMIQLDEPDVVIDAIRRVLERVASNRSANRARSTTPV
jgi:pimeloyl-ACP methyl ester carboxylesterase